MFNSIRHIPKWLSAVCALAILLIGNTAQGSPINYHFSWSGSASQTRTYSNSNFEISIVGQTTDVFSVGPNFINAGALGESGPGLPGSLLIAGTPVPFPAPFYVFADHIGVGDAVAFAPYSDDSFQSGQVIATVSQQTGLEAYSLTTSIGPLTDAFSGGTDSAVMTIGNETWQFTNTHDVSFEAMVNGSDITYSFSWSGSATNTRTYTNTSFEMSIAGNTEDVVSTGANFINAGPLGEYGPGLPGIFKIGGIEMNLSSALYVLADHIGIGDSLAFAPYTDELFDSEVIAAINQLTGLETYDLTTSLGPISDPFNGGNDSSTVAIGNEIWQFTGIHDVTATVRAGEFSTPEPGTLALLAIGVAGLIGQTRRQSGRRIARTR